MFVPFLKPSRQKLLRSMQLKPKSSLIGFIWNNCVCGAL